MSFVRAAQWSLGHNVQHLTLVITLVLTLIPTLDRFPAQFTVRKNLMGFCSDL